MTRKELFEKVNSLKTETQSALQLIYDGLNHGQQKKILKNEEVKALFDRYGVVYEEV